MKEMDDWESVVMMHGQAGNGVFVFYSANYLDVFRMSGKARYPSDLYVSL